MSNKRNPSSTSLPPNGHDDDEEEEDFDDEDDEDDFIPGQDDDDDDEPPERLQITGTLRVNANNHLIYANDENGLVNLASTEPLAVDLMPAHDKPHELIMTGTVQLEATSDAAPRRTMQMTLVAIDDGDDGEGNNATGKDAAVNSKRYKSTGDDDDDGGNAKQPAVLQSMAPRYYKIFGRQVSEHNAATEVLELRGAFAVTASFAHGEPVDLVCEARTISAKPSASAATVKSPFAAAARLSHRYHDDDDEDLDADGNDEIDFDELIALQEEAGLPVDQLRKRLAEQQQQQQQQQQQDYDSTSGVADGNVKGSHKKSKRNQEDDDDEYDGF